MTNLRKISTAIATTAVLLSSVAPAFAAGTVDVTGNGAFSQNTATQSNTTTTSVTQNNTANISNTVNSNSSTGGNTADFNTGGNTTVNTGDATNVVKVSTQANINQATVNSCGCAQQGTAVTISGNGAFSDNNADVTKDNTTRLSQSNDAHITNDITANARTGNNDAGFNTGGTTTINTGNAGSGVTVDNMANANVATIGGGAGTGTTGGSSVTISGNGAFSGSTATLDHDSSVVLSQDNRARVTNDVDANARTGGNTADFNTGGGVLVKTGDATSLADVSNAVNFNSADIATCGCALGGAALNISGNGAYSDSAVTDNADNTLRARELNDAMLNNDVNAHAKTGLNDSGFGTFSLGGGNTVRTGSAYNGTTVSNSGNANFFDQGATLTLPGDLSMNFNFNLSGLWGSLMNLL